MRLTAAKDRTFKTVRPNQGTVYGRLLAAVFSSGQQRPDLRLGIAEREQWLVSGKEPLLPPDSDRQRTERDDRWREDRGSRSSPSPARH